MDFPLIVPNNIDYLANLPEQVMSAMSFSPDHIMNYVALLLCMTFGYLLYTVAGEIRKRENIDPYPVYLHCWMITFDTLSAISSWCLLYQYHTPEQLAGGAWVFLLFSLGLPVWVFMEAKSILHTIKDEKQRSLNFRHLVPAGQKPTEKQARFWCLGTVAVCAALNLFIMSLLGGFGNFFWIFMVPFSNYVFAIWTWRFWTTRAAELGTRMYQSMKLHIVITVQITLMWVPGVSWYVALSPAFHSIWFYLCGAVMTGVAIYNTYKCSQLPKRDETLPNGKKPVW